MIYRRTRYHVVLEVDTTQILALPSGDVLLLGRDKNIYKLGTGGDVRLLSECSGFQGPSFSRVLQPIGDPHDPRGIAIDPRRKLLAVADYWRDRRSRYLNWSFLDLSGATAPKTSTISNFPSAGFDEGPFYFLGGHRIGVKFGNEECICLDSEELRNQERFAFISSEPSYPIIRNCLHPHFDGWEFSMGMGSPGRGVYRRLGLSSEKGGISVKTLMEARWSHRADLWGVKPSPSGATAFVLFLNHESEVILPGGPQASAVVPLGLICRAVPGKKVESMEINGDLSIDFGGIEASALSPYAVAKDAYRFYPLNIRDGGPPTVLCPINDDVVLYVTPGGTILEIHFGTRQVRELTRLGAWINTLEMVTPHGPLVAAGIQPPRGPSDRPKDGGMIWVLDVEADG